MTATGNGNVDPITLEILSHRLYQIAREMGITLERVGGTVNTTQQHDYMASLYTADGDVLSAGESLGQHVACAGVAVKKIIERFENGEGIDPDDIFLLNDPYVAAIHQSDVYVIAPIHYEGRRIAWSATFVHVMDIGAMSPGGNSPGATEICHEGLRVPGLKLVERGKLRQDVFDTLLNMTRQPVMVGLDLKCEIAANNIAKARIQEIAGQYGPELLEQVAAEIIRYTESVLRERIREFADGSWSGHSAHSGRRDLENAAHPEQAGRPPDLRLHRQRSAGQDRHQPAVPRHLRDRFRRGARDHRVRHPTKPRRLRPHRGHRSTGDGGQCPVPRPGVAEYHLGRGHVPLPGPRGAHADAGHQRELAPRGDGVQRGHRFARHAGVNQYGRYYVSSLSEGAIDGYGARADKDGVDSGGRGWHSCQNVEWVGAEFPHPLPVPAPHDRRRRGRAVPGRRRGGDGADGVRRPRRRHQGGGAGSGGVAELRAGSLRRPVRGPQPAGAEGGHRHLGCDPGEPPPGGRGGMGGTSELLPYCDFDLRDGGVLYMRMASGGGYGDPLDREPEAVLRDVAGGIISTDAAATSTGSPSTMRKRGWTMPPRRPSAPGSGSSARSLSQ